MELQKELLNNAKQHKDTNAFERIADDSLAYITYQQFAYDVFRIREKLMKEEANCVAIVGTNCYEWFCNMYASVLSGKRTLLCDALLPPTELALVLDNLEVEMVLYSQDLPELLEEIGRMQKSILVQEFIKNDIGQTTEGITDYLEGIQKISMEEGHIICLTSGTTNQAKGVVIATKAICCNAGNLAKVLIGQKGDKVYTSLPLHHLYAICKTLSFFHMGATLCLGSMRTIAKDIQLFHPKLLLTVPTVVDYLHKIDGFSQEITAIAVSGCKCEKHVEEVCNSRGILLQNIYGSSETAGGIALNMPGDSIDELTAIPGVTIEIAKDGEIILQPEGMMEEYYGSPRETYDKIHDGWLFSGDLGYIDVKGHLHVTGRKKEVIAMKNGDKIYCTETDEQLHSLPGVEEAAVIYAEDELVAVIFPEKEVTQEMIRQGIQQYNANQQIIRRISKVWIIQEPLPRTTTGKLLRNELTKRYIEQEKHKD